MAPLYTTEPYVGSLQSCPLGADLNSITTGLAGLDNPTGTYFNVDIYADTDLTGWTSIQCFGDQVNIFADLLAPGESVYQPLYVGDRASTSAEFSYLGGTLFVWCDASDGDCYPRWYDDHIVLYGAGGDKGSPQRQLDWFVKDLAAMRTNLAAAS